MILKWAAKDPDEVLDYQLRWTKRIIPGDTIIGSDWVVPDGITKQYDFVLGTTTTIWLAGGTDGDSYTLVNRVTTNEGRTMDQSVKIRCKAK